MEIQIENFRGIAAADIEVAGITLVAGKNGAGKTSVCQAVAAALAGEVIPIDDLTKAHAARLVRGGTPSGYVSARGGGWTASVAYPEATRSTIGEPPTISAHAAGMVSIVDTPKKDRAKILIEILHAEPGHDALADALKTAIDAAPSLIATVWRAIEAQGWDAAHRQARETCTRNKGQWEAVTGERYGSQKATAWIPRAWTPDMQGMSEQQLADELAHEREWLEAAISESAVTAAEITRLKTEAAAGPEAATRVESVKAEAAGLEADRKAIRETMAKIPEPVQTTPQQCPRCGEALCVIDGKISPVQPVDESVLVGRREAIADCMNVMRRIDAKITDLNLEYATARNALAAAQSAEKRLATLAAAPVAAGGGKSVDDCRSRVARAEARLAAFQAHQRAAALAAGIENNRAICEALDPNGLRKSALAGALADFNGAAESLCAAAGWRPVAIGADMGITYGGTPFMLASESEQFRCRAIIQLIVAAADKSCLVVIDRADILDGPGRNGLIKAILSLRASGHNVAAIIGMTIDAQDRVPNLAAIDGTAYWIENGTAIGV